MRGRGRVFQRTYASGKTGWFLAYYADNEAGMSREIKERAPSEAIARALLVKRLREVANAREGIKAFIPPRLKRVTVNDLLDAVVKDYTARGLKSLRQATHHMGYVRRLLGKKRAAGITGEAVSSYIEERLKAGAARATVARETELLRRAFSLARRQGRVGSVPYVPVVERQHANARQGFIDGIDFQEILAYVPDEDFRDALLWQWWTGCRHGELCSLTWGAYDGEAIRLPARDAKTGKGRMVPIAGPLAPILANRLRRRTSATDLVFHSLGRTMASHSGGYKPRLRAMWQRACETAGCAGIYTYDLRRSAIRNLLASGVPMKTAMSISGHETTSTFLRYQVVNAAEVVAALKRVESYVFGGQDAPGHAPGA